jgi:hypothetical protein
MSEIVKTYRQPVPPLAFVGKRYTDADRVDGSFGAVWQTWFANGWFAPLMPLVTPSFEKAYPEARSMIGLMRDKAGEPFEYWIGLFVPEGTNSPDGYQSVTLPKSDLGIGWVEGNWSDVFCQEEAVLARLQNAGMSLATDPSGAVFFFERYVPERFDTGKDPFILDIGFFVKPASR